MSYQIKDAYKGEMPFNSEPQVHAQAPPAISADKFQQAFTTAMTRVYGLMGTGLLLTAIVAWFVSRSDTLLGLIFGNPILLIGLFIGEIAMVIAISRAIHKLTPTMATTLFYIYAAVNGITLSFIFIAYTGITISMAFTTSAVLFGVMSLIGFTTKQDLTSMGRMLFMGLIGLIVASIVNIFLANSFLYWILTYAGIGIFLGLTMYHTQRVKTNTMLALQSGDQAMLQKVGILGALGLYLDFINLFLYILRLFGRKR